MGGFPRSVKAQDPGARVRDSRALQLHVDDVVAAVRADERRHVHSRLGLRPEGLNGVHGAAVGLQVDHGPVGAGHGGPGGGGHALPDGAPGEHEIAVGGKGCAQREVRHGRRQTLVDDDGILGLQRGERHADRLGRQLSRRDVGDFIARDEFADGCLAGRAQFFSQRLQGLGRILGIAVDAQLRHVGRNGIAPLAFVAEEVDGLIRPRQHHGLVGRQQGRRGLREVRHAGEGHDPDAPVDVGGEIDAEEIAAHGGPDACGRLEAAAPQGAAVHDERRLVRRLQHLRRGLDHAPVRRIAGRSLYGRDVSPVLFPLEVAGDDEACDLAAQGGLDCVGRVPRDGLDGPDRALPPREGLAQALDIHGQGGIRLQMPGGMLADDVEKRRAGPLGVVQVCDPVGQSRPQVQKAQGRLFLHPPVTVGSARADALEQPEHGLDPGDGVKGQDHGHLGCASVGKTDIDPGSPQ